MVDHILEIPRLVVFRVKSFKCDTTKFNLRNNPVWNKDDIEVVIQFQCLLGHPVVSNKRRKLALIFMIISC